MITNLTLSHFRNHTDLTVNTDGKSVVLTGENGSGKTNILEAISLLQPGRGMRGAKLDQLQQQSKKLPWAVRANVKRGDADVTLATGATPEGANRRRMLAGDRELDRGQDFYDYLTVYHISPRHDRLFLESPEDRRQFFDALVFGFDPSHADRLDTYEKAKSERRKLLYHPRPDATWLKLIEKQMAEEAIAIASARLEVIDRLNHTLADTIAKAMVGAGLSMRGDVEQDAASMPALQAEEAFTERLAHNRERDRDLGRTQSGVHRSDLEVTHTELNMPAASCSTGQQKMLLLSLMLAAAEARKQAMGRAPVLLLDEACAHLDEAHREKLANTILQLGIQTWLSGTDKKLFEAFGENAHRIEL